MSESLHANSVKENLYEMEKNVSVNKTLEIQTKVSIYSDAVVTAATAATAIVCGNLKC